MVMRKVAGPAIIVLLLFSSFVLSYPIQPSNANSISGSVSSLSCVSQVVHEEEAIYKGIDTQKAVATAENSSEFEAIANSHTLTLFGVAPSFYFDSATCSGVSLNAVSVDYIFNDVLVASCGARIPEGFQIFENAGLDRVTGASVTQSPVSCDPSFGQLGISPTSSVITNNHWSGYRVWYVLNGLTTTELYADTNFVQPSVGGNQECYGGGANQTCALAIWSGLENKTQTFLAQTGTEGSVYCTSTKSCGSPTYVGWYEFAPSVPRYTCPSTDAVSPGSTMEPVVENGLELSGTNTEYQTFLFGPGWTCSSPLTNFPAAGTTYYADAILERPTISNIGLATLATFSNVVNYGNIECYSTSSSSCFYFNTPYSNGWYDKIELYTTCSGSSVLDISISGIITMGNFTSAYKTNCDT